MSEFKIIGIETTRYGDALRFSGFYLEGVVGHVDPFVDGVFCVPQLEKMLKGTTTDKNVDDFLSAELEWAREQVGKTLICEDLTYRAFATSGKVEIR